MTESPTRRTLLRTGLTLAFAAPLLGSATAWADHDDDHDNDEDDEHQVHVPRPAPEDRFVSSLCRVADANSFSANNPGTDSLGRGLLRLSGRANNPDDDKIAVSLRGAPAGVSYEVMFLPVTGGRESLGTVGATSSHGTLNERTPNALSGAHRVGSFVLVRKGGNEDGHDEFVTCFGD
jgi:hypothetical protein